MTNLNLIFFFFFYSFKFKFMAKSTLKLNELLLDRN